MTTNNQQWRRLDDMPAGERVQTLEAMVNVLRLAVKAQQEGTAKEFEVATNRVIEQRQDAARQAVPDFTSTALAQVDEVLNA